MPTVKNIPTFLLEIDIQILAVLLLTKQSRLEAKNNEVEQNEAKEKTEQEEHLISLFIVPKIMVSINIDHNSFFQKRISSIVVHNKIKYFV